MSTEKKESVKKDDNTKPLKVSKPSIDFPVKVKAKDADPYHETGTIYEAGCKKAKELEKRGWVEIIKKGKDNEDE